MGALPGDNPIYGGGDNSITVGALPWNDVPIHYENLSANGERRGDPVTDREFDNPIYGRNETENGTYTHVNPDNSHQTGLGMGQAPYHEFDNPIYGRDNTYSTISDSSTTSSPPRNAEGRIYENINEESPLTDSSEQVYAHVN